MKKYLIALVVAGVTSMPFVAAADWDLQAFAEEETLELLTISETEGEHWFPIWLVVLDDSVFVRLGTRAAQRIEANTTSPFVSVRIAGETFEQVKLTDTPDMVDKVAEAMSEKYLSDILIKYFPHPLTMRLSPEP